MSAVSLVSSRKSTSSWPYLILAVVGPVLAYELILGTSHHRDLATGDSRTGPYRGWQYVLLGSCVALIGLLVTVRGDLWAPWLVAPSLTGAWAVDAASHSVGPEDMWPVGAAMLLAVGWGATALVVFVVSIGRAATSHAASGTGSPQPGWYSDPAGVSALRWWDGESWTGWTG